MSFDFITFSPRITSPVYSYESDARYHSGGVMDEL